MSTITTINSTDVIANSRTTINTNFSNLNTDKLEASSVAALTAKTTPVNADTFPITDTEASSVLKKLSFTNLKAFLKTYFDTLYPSGSGTSSGTNTGDNATNTQYSGLAASKQDTLVSATNIKTINSSSILGSGDIAISSVFKSGTTTKNAADASAAQTIAHGLGVSPKYVRITAFIVSSTKTSISTTVYNGTTQSSVSVYGAATTLTVGTDFRITLDSSGSDQTVGVVTFDATNITITWTKTGNPIGTHTLLWEANI